ncbi:MAG: DUF3656 domain-containing protein [Clostridia bacterium]|jgi:putative protease|nr:DUF3656 domain-containing protein [Clostridia bacterium]MCI2000209.1 DUF3656 domain-containing protein [Clostridia bacterium]MCI2014626.1 DUF3656 domain-containing protein [Clostridia bacterium]
MIKPELLSPAGSFECVRAAVQNGCDAVYIGGKDFSARQFAGNFDIEEIEKTVEYCHLRGIKVHCAVNTLYKNQELNDVMKYVSTLSQIGVDALIIQDIGLADIVKKTFEIPVHASTQLTANSLEDVNALYKNGFSRVVLSRELSLEEIKYILKNTEAEIETFIHGALCVSYSGQCIMSSMLGGRSGNRGRCAQTCRLPYSLYDGYKKITEGYLLSCKDIETVTILPKLIEAGITSFKIEGRMKNPEYVAGVTKIYRKYIDTYINTPNEYKVDEKDVKTLLQLFNRGGFTEGYYQTHSGNSMMSVERPKSWGVKCGIVDTYDRKHGRTVIRTREPLCPGDGIEVWTQEEPHVGCNINKASKAGEVINIMLKGEINKNDVVYRTHDKHLEDELDATFVKDTRQKDIFAEAVFNIGQPSSLKLFDTNGNSVFVQGDDVTEAENKPLSEEKIIQQISKTGGTPFKISNLNLKCDKDIYIGISSINKLRREAIEELEKKTIKSYQRKSITPKNIEIKHEPNVKSKRLNVQVSNILQFEAAVTNSGLGIIYFDMCDDLENNLDRCICKCNEKHIMLYAVMPRIYRKYSEEFYGKFLEKLKTSKIDGFIVRSLGQLEMLKSCGKNITVDYSANIFNALDVAFWENKGADRVTLSPELNLNEIRTMADKKCELLAYGKLPLMTTHQCPIGNFSGGKEKGMFCSQKGKAGGYFIKDRKGEKFEIMTDCRQCVSFILNGKPLFLLKFFDEFQENPAGSLRLIFTNETASETNRIIGAYLDMLNSPDNPSFRVKRVIEEMSENGSTKGHYFRGVE